VDGGADALIAKCKEIGRMLGGIIEHADTFWDDTKTLRESAPEYFAVDTDPSSN
jgi:hypothetical protein